ncbi:MAG: HAMP domain-containing protein [Chloroflexi bacterium]|nr:HAMP domain-containing protein [Chloroflexota bacterium]
MLVRPSRRLIRRLLLLGGVLLLAVCVMLVAAERLGAPSSDLTFLGLILLLSGGISLVVGALALEWGGQRASSLRVRIAFVFGAGLLVALANVAAASILMFLSGHDRDLLLLLLAFSAVVSLAFGYLAASALTEQLQRLTQVADRLAEGDFSARVNISGHDEVAHLAATFDHMAGRLEAAFERERALQASRRDLVAAVSHDLRTPLATTRAMIEAITDGVVTDPAEVQRYLGLMLREVHHLSRLIDDLFELSQIESGALTLRLEAVPLAELVATTLAAYDARARDAAIVLEQEVSPGLQPALADPSRLQRVLRNLLDNALHHTPPGGLIRVEALPSASEPCVWVRVSDSGPGVPVDERERVFERFYRGERSRQRGETNTNRVGAGLGLAIADGLVRAQRGRIWVEPTASGGAAFSFTVPLAT